MRTIYLHGLTLACSVERERGDRENPPSVDVRIVDVDVYDEEEFSLYLFERDLDEDWKELPTVAVQYLKENLSDEVVEKLSGSL